jgi:hypothetical protein
MISTAEWGTLVEATAALTPCPWLYVELGQRLERAMGEVPDDYPYAEWFAMYRDPEFNEYTDSPRHPRTDKYLSSWSVPIQWPGAENGSSGRYPLPECHCRWRLRIGGSSYRLFAPIGVRPLLG